MGGTGTPSANDPRKALGEFGESLAARFLTDAGYEIVARNARTRLGELDLVARDGEWLCFVEVKTRRSARFGTGSEAVDFRKQVRLRKLATAWLGNLVHSTRFRFDVVDVLVLPGRNPEIRHIPFAF
jgi:putative endonuclease